MPTITGQVNVAPGKYVINYSGVSNMTRQLFTFQMAQSQLYITNKGTSLMRAYINNRVVVIAPGLSVTITEDATEFYLDSDQNNQAFTLFATAQLNGEVDNIRTRFNLLPPSTRAYGTVVGYCGDSITNGAGASNASTTSFRAIIRRTLGYRVTSTSYNGGVSGDRSDQLLARMDSIIAQGVQVLSVMIGTNDAGQLVPLATYQANIKSIKDKADRAGLPIIFCLVPPRGSGTATEIKSLIISYNMWLRFWCATNGIPLVDTFTALVEPTTGDTKATYDADGTHPNDAGHMELGKATAVVFDKVLPKMPWPVTTKGLGLASNPLNADTTGWVALGGTATTSSIVADSALPAGNWRRFTLDNSGGGSSVNTTVGLSMDTSKYVVGDQLLFVLYINSSIAGKVATYNSSTLLTTPLDVTLPNTPLPLMFKTTVPSIGGTYRMGISFSAPAGTTHTFDVGAQDVFNLTTLGLTDIVV